MEENELIKAVETLLFITDEPIKTERMAKICEVKNIKHMEEILERIKHSYDIENRALCVMKVAGGWQMATRNEYSIWVRKLYQTRLTMRLSNAALETLCIIAYKQPVTRAQIEKIRGVDVMGPIDTLLERKLITVLGRAETIGRPILFGTTEEFLRQFGLNSLADLPQLENMISKESLERVNAIMDVPQPENKEQMLPLEGITENAENKKENFQENNNAQIENAAENTSENTSQSASETYQNSEKEPEENK
ncbi:MAG: SMC-Scp complex subunit ScpB [Elusimicrobia bacterium]|nr:SMC-Scp complex subunit ScpB [Elusimicrobiota bacterium]